MANHAKRFLALVALVAWAEAFWRMSCSVIQTGRIDPIIAPGTFSAHVHKLSGASNINVDSTFDSLQASRCTSCEVQDDKSAYWTPQLFYQHTNGSFQMVPNGGTVIYYLGRGENRSNIEPFPPGFKMLTGDNFARSYDSKTMTYSNSRFKGRPVADRVSFACLDSSGPSKERNYMWKTDCNNGMRAQVHFQSCWNGQDYQPDQSHVTYMSQIDNGVCPPSHPRQLPHLFFEVMYGVNDIDKSKGGRFVFANGDTTGYGFQGDFLNGWNQAVLATAIKKCINDDSLNGVIAKCPVLAASQTPYFSDNCPEMSPLVDEPIRGMLDALPGCNKPFSGPGRAPPPVCDSKPAINDLGDAGIGSMFDPSPGDMVGSWSFVGCAAEGTRRTLSKYSTTSRNMSIEYCTAACKAQGYPLAGMEWSKECYCASELTSGASYMKASTCSSTRKMTCAGNMTQYCGGPDLLTIWNDTSYTPPVELVVGQTEIAKGMATYHGCWAEGSSGRALSSDRTADSVGMTNEKCVAFCQAGGWAYAGTEYSQECYCGNDIANGGYNTTDISQCSMKCKGDVFSYCGAGNRLSVWKIKQSNKAKGPITAVDGAALWTGCYTDGGAGGRTLPSASFTGSSVSIDTCFAFCNKLNYPLFGMEYGQECYCGYTPKTQATVVPDGECKTPCAGDSTQKCGAGNRISIWNNTLYTPTVSTEGVNSPPEYLGCYTEGVDALALGDAKTTDKSKMTVETCATFCSGKGYHYLGVQNGQDCYCSKKGPSNGSIEAPVSECRVTCKGDKTQKCGAAKRLSVYNLARVSKTSATEKSTAKVAAAQVQAQKPASTSHSKTTLLKATATTKKAKTTSKSKTTSSEKPKTTSKLVKAKVQKSTVKTTTSARSTGGTKAKNKKPTTTTSTNKSRKTKSN
ncbi:fungistatic metabolite [Fusarium longipes]|uniref:Fungistatic metabolite n=1 Tax=Fusarium longipes TaxID=694270 RepID=A0A395TB03_9HYPO|nr:fungistatic metabolite [Fusarium longipes]